MADGAAPKPLLARVASQARFVAFLDVPDGDAAVADVAGRGGMVRHGRLVEEIHVHRLAAKRLDEDLATNLGGQLLEERARGNGEFSVGDEALA